MIPNKIYLQYFGYDFVDDDEPLPYEESEVDIDSVSWCKDKIFNSDIEYTRTPNDVYIIEREVWKDVWETIAVASDEQKAIEIKSRWEADGCSVRYKAWSVESIE